MTRHFGRRFVPQSTIDRRVQAKDDRINRATQRRAAKAAQLNAARDLLKPAPRESLERDDDPDDRDDRDEACGSQCGRGCGFCGRCS